MGSDVMSDGVEALKKELAKYKSIVENQSHHICVRDANNVITYVNQAYCDYYGLKYEDIIGTKTVPPIVKEDLIKMLDTISSMTPQDNTRVIEFRCIKKNKDVHWLCAIVEALFDENGVYRGFQSATCDITDRKLTELKLKEREEMYRETYKNFPLPSFTWKKIEDKFILIDFNESAYKITEGTISKIIGSSLDTLYKDTPEIIEDINYCYTYKTKLVKEMKYKYRLLKEVERDLIITYVFVPPNYVLLHTEDVTEKKKTEQALRQSEYVYRQMFEKNRTIKLLVDADTGEIVKANPSASEFYGYPLSKLEQMNILDINPFLTLEKINKIKHNIKRNRPYKFKHKLASGELRDVEVNACILHINNKTLFYSIIYDVTERNQAMDELKKKNDELRYFAHTISHEIKNPLSSVLSYLRVVERTYDMDEEMSKTNEKIKHRILKMSDMINTLLSYSNLEKRSMFTNHSIETILKEAMDNLEEEITVSKVEIVFDDMPVLRCDKIQMISLFQNLIGNAIKYCDKTVPQIHIKTKEEKGFWFFSVKDNGIGISKDNKAKIFNIFQRYDDNDKYSGHGIGLSFCKRIVENHGGAIWVDSTLEEGSTFYFTISKTPDKAKNR